MEKLLFENSIRDNKTLFISVLREISRKLKVNPNWLMYIFKKESGLNPRARNNINATGLNQMLPSTLKRWNLTPDDFQQMNSVEQLQYIYEYFKPFAGRFKSIYDMYLYNFYPYAVGKPLSYIIGSEKSMDWAKKVRSQNKSMTTKEVISLADYFKFKEKQILKNVPKFYLSQFQLNNNNKNVTVLFLSMVLLAFLYFR